MLGVREVFTKQEMKSLPQEPYWLQCHNYAAALSSLLLLQLTQLALFLEAMLVALVAPVAEQKLTCSFFLRARRKVVENRALLFQTGGRIAP